MATLYKITNLINGKFYVGSAANPVTRFSTHRRELRTGIHHCSRLQRAWDKHGEAAFRFAVVETFDDGVSHIEAEGRMLESHFGKPYCYNTGRAPGAAFLGRTHTEKVKRKLSKVHRGRQHRLGHMNSPEHRAKISAALKGRVMSPEHAEKIRQRMIGTSYAKGRVATEEMRAAAGRAVIEETTGRRFATVIDAAKHFGLERPNLIRTMRRDGLVKRGPCKGLHFRYLDTARPAC